MMGFQDALFQMKLAFESPEAEELADLVHETIAYHAILSSGQLAEERGAYPSYKGSKWDRDIFPVDTLDILELQRGVPVEVSRTSRLDWRPTWPVGCDLLVMSTSSTARLAATPRPRGTVAASSIRTVSSR